MPGPTGKHPTTRRKAGGGKAAVTLLVTPTKASTPPLMPIEHAWHPLTLAWWDDLWQSAMAAEYEESDIHGLYLLAVLIDAFWVQPSKELAAEIRLQRACFGLTALDRRRLQWEIDRGEQAQDQSSKRRRAKKPSAREDPRRLLA